MLFYGVGASSGRYKRGSGRRGRGRGRGRSRGRGGRRRDEKLQARVHSFVDVQPLFNQGEQTHVCEEKASRLTNLFQNHLPLIQRMVSWGSPPDTKFKKIFVQSRIRGRLTISLCRSCRRVCGHRDVLVAGSSAMRRPWRP